MAFHKLHHASERKYGSSSVRPQDMDSEMMVVTRRNNLGINPALPINYAINLLTLPSCLNVPVERITLPARTTPVTEWIDDQYKTAQLCTQLMEATYVGFDFEFHQKDSYEGFICVTSLASKERTFVIESLYENRKPAITSIYKLLENPKLLKIFCGADNGLIRVKKDWNCFPVNVLDLQDLFVMWKLYNYPDCYNCCSDVIRKSMSEKSKVMNDFEVNDYLRNYTKPSLEFLIRVLLNQNLKKMELCTFADYRRRPLHPDLISYSGLDAQYAFRIFEIMAKKVSNVGIQKAVEMSGKKLLKFSSPPTYKSLKLFTSETVGVQVQKWREYLSKNLDKNPDLLISNSNVKDLIAQILHDNALCSDERQLSILLKTYQLADDCTKAARHLVGYLDFSQSQLEQMKEIICHRCNSKGHTARFCCTVLSKDEWKDAKMAFKHRSTNYHFNVKQSRRRWENYCRNRNLNPDTTEKPWEKE